MRLTRFRVASMIAILGCGAAWSSSLRAQTGLQRTQTTVSYPPAQLADPFQLRKAPSTTSTKTLDAVQVSAPDGSFRTNKAPSNDQASPSSSSQLTEPRNAPAATQNPNGKRQVVDLRDRIASNPNAARGQPVSSGQQLQSSAARVDSAIPQQLFDQAQMVPREDTPGEELKQQPAETEPVPEMFSSRAAGQPQLKQGLSTKPDSALTPTETSQGNAKTDYKPTFSIATSSPPESDPLSGQVGYCPSDFSDCSGPQGSTFDPYAAAHVYRGKFAITTQRPLVELWRPLYSGGVFAPALTWFGVTNPMKPHFLVYGDMRTAVGVNHNSKGKSNVWGNVLNLDMDLQLTSTERVHAFVSPLNRGTTASGVSFNDELDLINGTNFNFNTLFFEGDVGALLGGAQGTYPPFDLPFTFGLIPLIYQNGIWANDAVLGAAVALPARHSRALKWSNFDATFFWATDNVTTDAFPNQDSAADFFGTAWFIDAYEGYIEADYAFVNDNTGSNRGYHNMSMAFSRRYLSKLSNSVRFIVNTGQQDLAPINRTADGHLLLIENSFISAYPNTIVPYLNLFYGQGRPQSLARFGIAGGILTNTGINFETDGMTGYPTLDPTGSNAFGFASGINMLGSQFAHQLILEFAMLHAVGSRQLRNAAGDEYGVGVRYQKPLSHNLIFRTDHMAGFREDATNITGSRIELRWKF